MGIYMSSHAMIGVMFVPENRKSVEDVRGCNHVESDSNFCSECGKSMYVQETRHISQLDLIEETYGLDECITEDMYVLLKEHFGDNVVSTGDYNGENYYFGYGLTVEDHEVKRVDIPNDKDIENIKENLKTALDQYEIWDQCKDSFGFWVVSTGG